MKWLLNIKNHILAIFVFLLISLTLIFSWFRFGHIYGGGDVGLQTYNPPRILEIVTYIWWEATAPGAPTPQGLSAIPFNLMFSFLKWFGFSTLMLQISLFFSILLLMGLGMYFLILFLFGKDYRKYAILGGLFYMLNPYMMISVWHRFVHSTFFISAALPFLIIFWLKWIKNKAITSLLMFLVVNLLALYGFGTLAYILTLWIFLFSITIPEIIFPWLGWKNARKIATLFIIGFIIWILTNIWWILPILKIAPSFLSEQHNNQQSIATLYTLSFQTAMPFLLQMVNPYYLFSQLDFGISYENIFIRVIPFIFVSIILIGILKGKKNVKTAKWSIIYPLILILSKGAASPFGFFYIFGMKHFFSLGVLRNPFEKMGILLPLVSSILLVIGVKVIFDYFKTRTNINILKFSFLIIFFLTFAFCWPMFTGQIFGKINEPAFVKVPDSYKEANSWINTDYSKYFPQNPGKILHLPLTIGESITYNWEHGYSGLEPSNLFFTVVPSISHGFNLKQVDNSLAALYHVFHSPIADSDTILRLLQDFNVRYVVLHKDVKWQGGEFYDPNQTEDILGKLNFFEAPQKFDDLVVYKISDNYFKPRISIAENFNFVSSSESSTLWPWILSSNRALITNINKISDKTLDSLPKDNIIYPKNSFRYTEASSSSTIQLINNLVLNNSYEDVWLAPLTRLSAVYRASNEIQNIDLNDRMIAATKELIKILRSVYIEKKNLSSTDLVHYANEMDYILSSNSIILVNYANDKTISNIFQAQLYMLRILAVQFQPNNQQVIKIADDFKKDLVDNNFISAYYTEGNISDLPEKTVMKFDVDQASDYELILTSSDDKEIFLTENMKVPVSLDGNVSYVTINRKGNLISLGNIFLSKGKHEIDLPIFYSDNLILEKDEKLIQSVGNNIGSQENNIRYATGGDIFQISFTAKVEEGNGFYIQLLQDTDITGSEGQINYQVNQFISQTPGSESIYEFPLPAFRTTTKNASVRFLAVYPNNKNLQPSSILIKNLRVVRIFNGDIFLRKNELKTDKNDSFMKVSIEQKSPVLYNGKIHLDKSGFFIFRESYHPGWKLTLSKNGQEFIYPPNFLANLYSNAWFIKDKGDYNYRLEFQPQKIVHYGLLISLMSYAGLILSIFFVRSKRNEKN